MAQEPHADPLAPKWGFDVLKPKTTYGPESISLIDHNTKRKACKRLTAKLQTEMWLITNFSNRDFSAMDPEPFRKKLKYHV